MSEPQPHPSGELDGEDEEAPRAEPAGLADERFAVNVRENRERLKLSQGEVARRMAEQGFPFYQQTIRRIEEGRRKVSVGEAKALARILKTPMERLTWPRREAEAAELLDIMIGGARRAWQDIRTNTETLLFCHTKLEKTVSECEHADYFGSGKVRELAGDARRWIGVTPESAVEAGREEHGDTLRRLADERR